MEVEFDTKKKVSWRKLKIREFSRVVRGGSPRPAGDPRYFGGDYMPWLTVASLTNLDESKVRVTETKDYLTVEGVNYSRVLEKNTLIIANSGATLGVAKILDLKCCANDGIAALLEIKGADNDFLAQLINSKTDYLRKVVATGNGQPNLNTTLIGDIEVLLPPLGEQIEIASVLSDIDKLISHTELIVTKKRNIKHATMQQLLTGKTRLPGFKDEQNKLEKWEYGVKPTDWIVQKFGDCISFVIDNRGKTPPLAKEGYPLLEVNAIYKQGKSPNQNLISKFVDEHTYNNWFRGGHPIAGDILIVTVGSAGETSYCDGAPVCIAQNIIAIRIKSAFFSEFIYYLSQTPIFKMQVSQVLMGAVQPSLKVPHLKKFNFAMPTKAEQERIVDTIRSMDSELKLTESKLQKLKLLKQGMMQELLTGRIRLV